MALKRAVCVEVIRVAVYLELVYLVTALVPSETACLAPRRLPRSPQPRRPPRSPQPRRPPPRRSKFLPSLLSKRLLPQNKWPFSRPTKPFTKRIATLQNFAWYALLITQMVLNVVVFGSVKNPAKYFYFQMNVMMYVGRNVQWKSLNSNAKKEWMLQLSQNFQVHLQEHTSKSGNAEQNDQWKRPIYAAYKNIFHWTGQVSYIPNSPCNGWGQNHNDYDLSMQVYLESLGENH